MTGHVRSKIAAPKAAQGGEYSWSSSASRVRWLWRPGPLEELHAPLHPLPVGSGIRRFSHSGDSTLKPQLRSAEPFESSMLNLQHAKAED